MQQIELLKLKLSEITSAVENGWDNETDLTDLVATSNPSAEFATSNPSAELSDNSVLSKEQCSGNQLECNLLRPVTGVSLHWKSLRSVSQCHCGVSFSYAQRKVMKPYNHLLSSLMIMCVMHNSSFNLVVDQFLVES